MTVSLDDRPGWPFSFVGIPDDVSVVERRGFGAATLWIRRPRAEAGKGLTGIVRTARPTRPGHEDPLLADSGRRGEEGSRQ